jgi:hypothetical protein
VRAEFEEKTFEIAANHELALLGGRYTCPACGAHHCPWCGAGHRPAAVDIWAPGQVLEGVLGFDVLVDLQGDATTLEALLGVAIPPGMHWKQHFGSPPGAGAAPDWASLFLQYKRPSRLQRRRGEFLKLFAGPYFRFDLDTDQHQALAGLRAAAQGQALVCYAAPRFHTNADMLHYRQNRLVLERTAFIEADDDDKHDYGAYDENSAFLCSEPHEPTAHSLPGFLGAVRQLDLPSADTLQSALRAHLGVIASAVREVRGEAAGDIQNSDERRLETDVRSILTFAAGNETAWLLAAVGR